MCSQCICKMRIADGFRSQCQETDRILRSAYKNNLNVQCWTKEEICLAQKIGKVNELDRQEEIPEYRATTSPVTNIPGTPCLPEDSETVKISVVGKVGDDKSVITKDLTQAQKLIIAKKMKFDKGQKPRRFCNDKTMENRLVSEETKKEVPRSRRLVAFKRVTSMQSLKNSKERQRQHIKKTVYGKNDGNHADTAQTGKNNVNGARKVSDTGSVYKCKYSKKISLETHELSHDGVEFFCDHCDERFCRLNDFLEHAKAHDPKEKVEPAICKICNKSFRKTVTMIRHLNVHKRDNPRAVYTILKDIRDKKKLKNDRSLIEDEKTIEISDKKISSDLGKDEVRPKDLRDFEKNALDAESTNDDVSYSIALRREQGERCSSEESRQRQSSNRDGRGFVCTVCDAKIASDEMLKSHREICGCSIEKARQNPPEPDDRSAIKLINIWIKEELDSDNEGKGFPCESCNKSYATMKSLSKHRAKMHENVSSQKITHRCTLCDGKDCTCADRIKDNRGSPQEKSKTHTCEECNKTFEKQSKLEKHMGIHARAKEQRDTNFKRFLCHICSKTFRQNTGLMFHMRTHTGYKPHVCKYCGRGFTSNSNCINHERTHTGDRPFVCHFCSAAFAKSCTLKAHITTHTGEANYHCKTCGKSFRRLKYLKEHRFTHTGEKPYACKICGTAYSHSGSLFVHEKKCKAQQVNYQALSAPVSQNYCENQAVTIGEFSAAIAPISGTLPTSHDVIAINNSLSTHENKNYVDGVTRISAHCASEGTVGLVHSSTVNPAVPSTGRSFTIIGQMFHT